MSSSNPDDLDAFLTLLESKLRGPFSSLDLAKAVSTASLSDTSGEGAKTYLHNVLHVLPRAEKVTQLRCLVGLLGLEPLASTDTESLDKSIENIVQAAQEDPIYEEWVRIVAGLVEGILFETNNDTLQKDDDATTIARGREAKKLLDKTCSEILDRVRKVERATSVIDEDSEHLLAQSDADPLILAPYQYALLRSELLEAVIPEVKGPHYHFRVNQDADILSVDAKLELEKAREEKEHRQTGLMAAAKQVASAATVSARKESDAPEFPGLRGTGATKPAPVQRPKSSMFMPAKKPPGLAAKRPLNSSLPGGGVKTSTEALGQRGVAAGLKPVVKPALHQRKAGAAQALLAKGRARARLMKTGTDGSTDTKLAPSTTPTLASPAGRAAPSNVATHGYSVGGSNSITQRSKMKIIDVAEVQGLESKKQEQVAAVAQQPTKVSRGRKATPLVGQKRQVHDSANGNEKVSRLKVYHGESASTKTVRETNGESHAKPPPTFTTEARTAAHKVAAPVPGEGDGAGAIAAAALLAYQQSQQRQTSPEPHQHHSPTHTQTHATSYAGMDTASGHATNNVHPSSVVAQKDWRSMLQQTSNRLSDEDRIRIQQFFVQHFNPTPGQTVYKMKLHEERTTDPKTGNAVKETYYLELDYSNFTSKQSKKVKRY
jgi:ribosomal protein L20A (L18A)